MRVSCPSCQTNYNIDDKRIPPGGAKLKCTKCQTMFPVRPGAADAPAAVPLPSSAPASVPPSPWGGSVPLPGAAFGGTNGDRAVPLPGGGFPGAVPLPGSPFGGSSAGNAVPLPGFTPPARTSPAVPLPPAVAPAGAVPLPSASRPGSPSAVPLPSALGSSPAPATARVPALAWPDDTQAVPLPGGAGALAPSAALTTPAVPLPGFESPLGDAVPLPGFAAAEDVMAETGATQSPSPAPEDPFASFTPMNWDTEATAVRSTRVPTAAFRPAEERSAGPAISLPAFEPAANPAATTVVVPEPGPDDVGFADADLVDAAPPTPHNVVDLTAPASPALDPGPSFANELDFSELNAPAPAEPSFDHLPVPATPDLPTPASAASEEVSLDFSEPAAPTQQHVALTAPHPVPSFGEVDLGGSAGGPESLEFDPSASAPSPAPAESFEADLSAPAARPSTSTPADGLEMLSFIDDAAKGAKPSAKPKVKRYHVRRRNGKVFGPFDEGVVVKMLEDGQLLGNEDVSLDADYWSAIGSVGAFGEVIQRLMEASSPGLPAQAPVAATDAAGAAGSQASMERLKQLYEGRMAAVAVADRKSEPVRRGPNIPLIVALALLVLAVAAGAGLGFTRYGVFGLKQLFPAKISQGSPEFAELTRARAGLLLDTFRSYSESARAAQKLLGTKEYPEVRALWCQAIFYLDRRYAAATPADVNQARSALEDIQLLGPKNVEVVKAMAGDALVRKQPDQVVTLLEAATKRPDNEADTELSLLYAEALTQKRDFKGAADVLQRVLAKHKDSAKALHALGDVRQADKKADEAAKLYADALAVDGRHISSAIELAAVELLVRKDAGKAAQALAATLDEKNKALMGPAELARARALHGLLNAVDYKPQAAQTELEEALKLDPDSSFIKASLGRVLLMRQSFADAVPLLQGPAAKDPQNLDYTEAYLTALIGAGKMADAKNAVADANTRFPGNARIAYLFGRVEDALDNTTEAESHYKRAVNADPGQFEANLYLGLMYLRFKRVAEAKPEIDAALKTAPKNPRVHSGAGELALGDKDYEKAKTEFQTSIDLDPNHARGYLGLGEVALAQNRLPEAKQRIQKALELEPSLPGGRLTLGTALWRGGDLEGALAELEKAKQQEPGSTKVLIALTAVHLDKADKGVHAELGPAEAAISAALGLEPTNPECLFYMARVKDRRIEYTQAIDSMRNAIDRAPDNASYHYELGTILRDAKKMSEAVEEWSSALKLDPHYAAPLEALGRAALDRGDFAKAVDYFEQCLKVDPSRTAVLTAIGDAYFQDGKWDSAISRYQQALKANPKDAAAYYQIGRCYSEKSESGKAIDWYRKATATDPKNAQAFYFLGFAYKDRNQKREAIDAFEAYLKLSPSAEDKKEIEDEIYDLQH